MIEQMKIKKGNLSHSRVLEVNYKGELLTFQATNHRDKFPDDLIEELRELIHEMQDHNELMDIRDLERK